MLKELKPNLGKEINKIKRNLDNFCENYKFKKKRKKLSSKLQNEKLKKFNHKIKN